jgi:hypothetical protein
MEHLLAMYNILPHWAVGGRLHVNVILILSTHTQALLSIIKLLQWDVLNIPLPGWKGWVPSSHATSHRLTVIGLVLSLRALFFAFSFKLTAFSMGSR